MSYVSSMNIYRTIFCAFYILGSICASDALGEESASLSQKEGAPNESKCQSFVMKGKDYYFSEDKVELSPQERKKLEDDIRALAKSVENAGEHIRMSVEGFCSEKEGSQEECNRLGELRIENIKQTIMSFGVKDENIAVITLGNMNYSQSQNSRENRRVHLYIMLCSEGYKKGK